MKTIKIIIIAIIIATSFSANAQLTGIEIVEKSYNREAGKDQTSTLTMTLTDKQGKQRIRVIKQFNVDLGKVEKKIMFFQSPADVKNVSFMNWSYDNDKADDQWIFLPALKKTKRISSDSKSDYFMGSDFTYDDLGDRKLEADVHTLLQSEVIDGKDCYIIESVSIDDEYMYSKTITWIRKDNFVGVKKEFYDEDDELLKILTIKKIEQVSEIWVITSSKMENVQKKHSTTIELSDVQINTGVSSSKFTERMMMRGL